jgi:hypothetical protein
MTRMKRSEYERLKKQIEDDYRRKIDALETVWQMVSSTTKTADVGNGSSHFAKLISDLIDRLPDSFTVREVEAKLAETPGISVNRSTVSHTLKRMSMEQSKIRISYAGAGKRPTLYERVISSPYRAAPRQTDAVVGELKALVQQRRLSIPKLKLEVLQGKYGVDFVRDLSDGQMSQLRAEIMSGALDSLAEEQDHTEEGIREQQTSQS